MRQKNPRLAVSDQARAAASVFIRQDDREDADGLFRVGWIFAAVHEVSGLVVNLPEDALPVVFKGAKVAFAVGGVALAEVLERLDLLTDG